MICTVKAKDSSGYDGVSIDTLKMCNSLLSKPLYYICNKSIQTGVFPDRIKYAVVKYLFKNGDSSRISNYRPISLLPVFSKILEKSVYSRLNQHLSIHNTLATHHLVHWLRNIMDLRRIGQQNMQLMHLLMEYFRLGIVGYKILEFFVTSLRLSTV